ncbi:hypothetical protein F5X99DRAFT_89743 [Biscogniauxia marginata]|nr:hypothetical protein F5X99DRAFT_89743 [Biscogniauxia marginata]
MFASCCRRQTWRLPGCITLRGLYPVRNISCSPSRQDTPSSETSELRATDGATDGATLTTAYAKSHTPGEFPSRTAQFLALETLLDDSEKSPFSFQYLPQERRYVFKQNSPEEPRWQFRTLVNSEPTKQWKVKVYDKTMASIHKSVMSARQVRSHVFPGITRVLLLNKVRLEKLGTLKIPEGIGETDILPVDEKDLQAWVERDGYHRPVLLWVAVSHLEFEALADGRYARQIKPAPRIWENTLEAVMSGNTPSSYVDDFAYVLDRFSDTFLDTTSKGPGRTIFGEDKVKPLKDIPVIFSVRHIFLWFIWKNCPEGPLESQYCSNWIPKLPAEFEKPKSKGKEEESSGAPWTPKLHKRVNKEARSWSRSG